MFVYTGSSDKEDGFLILSSKGFDSLAKTMGCHHFVLNERDRRRKGVHHLFVRKKSAGLRPGDNTTEFTDAQLWAFLEEPRWGIWVVYRDSADKNRNLEEAVCW